MITHYIFFRYEPGFLDDEKIAEMTEVFTHVCRDVKGAESFTIDRNAVARASNMDVMVTIHLTGEQALSEYLQHPEHTDIARRYAPHISAMFSFDKTN